MTFADIPKNLPVFVDARLSGKSRFLQFRYFRSLLHWSKQRPW